MPRPKVRLVRVMPCSLASQPTGGRWLHIVLSGQETQAERSLQRRGRRDAELRAGVGEVAVEGDDGGAVVRGGGEVQGVAGAEAEGMQVGEARRGVKMD